MNCILIQPNYQLTFFSRHLKTVRKHLGSLTFKNGPMIVDEMSWHNGITEDWWNKIDWESLRENQDLANNFDREVCSKVYLGGIEAPLRPQVCLKK